MTDKQLNNNDQLNNKSLTLIFFVNGKKVIDKNPDPECTLLTYLRDKLYLCGTKLGCGEGGCGACTVLVSKVHRNTNQVRHLAVNACLTPVCSMHGSAVTTIEGIGSTRTRLHPVQERIAKAHGSQCGFCTPGIVMSMYALLRSSPQPNMKDLEITFQGNLCRCTGYRPIIEGYKTFIKEFSCGMGDKCCKLNRNGCPMPDNTDNKLFEKSEFLPYDASQEPIFPPELILSDALDNEYLKFKSPRVTWYRPTTINELLQLKCKYPDAKIVVGNTEIGVEVKFKHFLYPILINTAQVKELNEISENENGIFLGASATLMDIDKVLRNQIKILPECETRIYQSMLNMMHYFAGKQIRNVASLGGNIMTGSPISDMNPILTAVGIELVVGNAKHGNNIVRSVNMGQGFFTGYRRNVIESHEVLIGLKIPKTTKNQFVIAYKQAKRRDDDIAIVNAAFNIIFIPNTNIVEYINMAFGGMAPTTVLAPQTCKLIVGKKWTENLIETITESLCKELPLSPSAPGGMISYRRSLVTSLFFKTFLAVSQKLEAQNLCNSYIGKNEKSGADVFHTQIPKSSQLFEKASKNQPLTDPIGRPKIHSSAFKQATGEAVYCDDMPKIENELYLALVMSTKAHAKIISIDSSEALKLDGVHAFYSSKDLSSDENKVGAVFHDEEIFASNKVTCFGQVIGAIIAENQALAQRASRVVKIAYEDITPVIVSIEDAIKYKSYFPDFPKSLINGNVEEAFKNSDHIIESSCRMGGQEHFYLETHAALAIPKDNGDELEIFCSTQHPSEVQKLVARSLSIPAAKVVCRVKRLGGGFGGKESRSTILALPVAFAAYKLRRPIRCMLDRDEDMILTGTRHPFYFKYKVGCSKDGKMNGCEINIYANAGCSTDLSFAVLDRAIFHYQNSYKIPNVKVIGWLCKTNLPSNTAFRGFGGPQGMFAGEHIIRDVANVCGMDYVDVAYKNLYRAGDATHFSQIIESDTILRCWSDCINQAKFYEQRQQVDEFNKQNKWRKRGVAICPTMYGISFTALHLNQGGALINIYEDGSVLLTHGGTEMGQGVHIKMIQVAAKTLGIPQEKIFISETSTDKVPNTSPTAASCGSDLNGMAVLEACQKLNKRLESIKNEFPNDTWESWIKKAYYNRISLSAPGFYKTPNIGYNYSTNTGNPFSYYTNGAAVSLVEIDCLTGDHQVLKTDIVMDIGSSINPAIDIGQIEGAFMQGYGLFTMEEMIYSTNGIIYSRGPGMYKLPGFADIPAEFNVSILTGAPNPRAVYSSKAVGEPPLFLAATVFFAIKEAILAARKEQNKSIKFNLYSPATSARIRMACEDKFTKLVKDSTNDKSLVPWNIEP